MKKGSTLLILIALCSPLYGDTLDEINQNIVVLDSQSDQYKRQYAAGKKANEERLRKAEDARARNRPNSAEELLQQAYAAAEELNQINSRLNQIQQQRSQLCRIWREEYERTIDSLLLQAQNEKDRNKKGEIGRKLQFYQSRNEQLCSESLKSSLSQEWKSIQIEAYDGPAEIQQKTQMLNAIAREVSIDLAKLDQQYQNYQREQKTKDRAQEFIQESTLFTDSLTVRPATRSDGISTNTEGQVGHSPEGGASTDRPPQILGNGDWPSTSEEFESQYQKMRSALLTQQKQLQSKIEEFELRAKALMNP